jgi:hypothetical protein
MGAEAETEYWRLAGRYGTKAEPGGFVVGPFGVLEMQDAKARDFDEVINLLMRTIR